MSHILRQLGEAALQFRKVGPRKVIAPLLNRRQLKDIREEWLAQGKEWPYEHIYPGVSKNETPYEGQVRRGQIKREAHREARAKHIEECMAKMPDLIEEYRASRRVKWEDVSAADKMLLNAKQIRFKYVYKRMMNK